MTGRRAAPPGSVLGLQNERPRTFFENDDFNLKARIVFISGRY